MCGNGRQVINAERGDKGTDIGSANGELDGRSISLETDKLLCRNQKLRLRWGPQRDQTSYRMLMCIVSRRWELWILWMAEGQNSLQLSAE